ncbi:hypothetical protein RHMOL_Rhmol05G0172100 [Rhododendron molle]|uniref:Uncharacterized protein n=1 Tax=Rhododendron molle TaxID=49168 RepID=A0ACC0NQ70_RHOML|nr:hypothetical protein RHMOL_Rhmol05G0172100 [Rhododendron molle]
MRPASCCVALSFRVADKYVADVEAREPTSSRSHGIIRTEEIGGAKIAEVDLIAEQFLAMQRYLVGARQSHSWNPVGSCTISSVSY